jgi:hypothetical protein
LLNVSVEQNVIPFFAKKGWTRHEENAAKHPLNGADGVVVSSYRLFIPNGFDNWWLETTTPTAPAKERGHFFMAQPPLLREEGDYVLLKRRVRQQALTRYTLSRRWRWATGAGAELERISPCRG